MDVFFLPHGAAAAFDDDGSVNDDGTIAWVSLYVEYIEQCGIDPASLRLVMPNGAEGKVVKHKPTSIEDKVEYDIVVVIPTTGSPIPPPMRPPMSRRPAPMTEEHSGIETVDFTPTVLFVLIFMSAILGICAAWILR